MSKVSARNLIWNLHHFFHKIHNRTKIKRKGQKCAISPQRRVTVEPWNVEYCLQATRQRQQGFLTFLLVFHQNFLETINSWSFVHSGLWLIFCPIFSHYFNQFSWKAECRMQAKNRKIENVKYLTFSNLI
jgi:fatty acid desaturase